jgi:hypothetical protein
MLTSDTLASSSVACGTEIEDVDAVNDEWHSDLEHRIKWYLEYQPR